MIPALFFFLTVSGLLFFSVVEMAFGLLMRLPERLEAEREGEHGALAPYLSDPLEFFVPARLMRGALLVLAIVLLAQQLGTGGMPGLVLFFSGLGIVIGIGQILPALIVRRSPERFLDILLPAFTVIANVLAPITMLVITWLGPARERQTVEGNGIGLAAVQRIVTEQRGIPFPVRRPPRSHYFSFSRACKGRCGGYRKTPTPG